MPFHNKASLILSNRNNPILLKLNRAYVEKYQGIIGARFWNGPEPRLSFKLRSRDQQLGQSKHPSLYLPPQGGMKFQPLLIFIPLSKVYTGLDQWFWISAHFLVGKGQSPCSQPTRLHSTRKMLIPQKTVGCFREKKLMRAY